MVVSQFLGQLGKENTKNINKVETVHSSISCGTGPQLEELCRWWADLRSTLKTKKKYRCFLGCILTFGYLFLSLFSKPAE